MPRDMSLKLIDRGKDYIEFEVENSDYTLLIPLVEELNRDEDVEFAKYTINHPTLDNPKLYVKVKKGKPQASIKRAIKKLEKVVEDLQYQFEKEVKKR